MVTDSHERGKMLQRAFSGGWLIFFPFISSEYASKENHAAPMGCRKLPVSYNRYLLWYPLTVQLGYCPLCGAWRPKDPCRCSYSWQCYRWQSARHSCFWVSFGPPWLALVQDVQETLVAVVGVENLSSGIQVKLLILLLWRWEENSAIGMNMVYL